MTFEPLKLAEPWSWLVSDHQPLRSLTPLDGSGSIRLLCSLNVMPLSVVLPSGRCALPPSSFPFVLGQHQVQAWHLPTDPRTRRDQDEFLASLFVQGTAAELRLRGGVARPAETYAQQSAPATLASTVDSWIDWQVWAFQELGHVPDEPEEYDAATRAAIVRRSWTAAAAVWLREGSEEARMALIVQLSRERELHRVLDALSRQPRQILQRYRENTLLSRIQELDSACIRDFARRPGITAIEKAGPRQSLLAVRRREQRDTLENRVTCWVMEQLVDLAADYRNATVAFPSDPKVDVVRRFGQRSASWRASELLRDVSALHQHPNGPNYPLQFEQRYRTIWKTYLRIRREKWVKDDAWTWQRVLWGETGRQLVGCCLEKLYTPAAISTPFYRTESRQGCWTEAPAAPGPYHTASGDCLLFDSRDLDVAQGRARRRWLERPPFPGAQYMGASGCDQLLLWPKANRALLLWHFYHAALEQTEGGLQGVLRRCGLALEQLGADLHRFAGCDLRLSGLLVVADLGRTATQDERKHKACVVLEPAPRLRPGGGVVNALCLPPDVDAWTHFAQDFKEGMQLVLEEVFERV